MLISIMFDLNLFYCIKVLKLHYLCFLLRKKTLKKLFCFYNEQMESADSNYALKETLFNNVTIQREF